jgi:hypothetical protein
MTDSSFMISIQPFCSSFSLCPQCLCGDNLLSFWRLRLGSVITCFDPSLGQETPQNFGQPFDIPRFATPNHKRLPAEFFQLLKIFLVAFDIARQFLVPEFSVGGRSRGARAALMAVPETSMHEDHLAQPRQDYIRASGQVTTM